MTGIEAKVRSSVLMSELITKCVKLETESSHLQSAHLSGPFKHIHSLALAAITHSKCLIDSSQHVILT